MLIYSGTSTIGAQTVGISAVSVPCGNAAARDKLEGHR